MSAPSYPSPVPDRRALYLRWRPHRFAEVVGQGPVTRTLRNAVSRKSVAHAYLLCGPRGTGKTTLARILYKALNCQQPDDGEPCGVCQSCLAADGGRALDLVEIDAASNRGIDDIRALRERVRFAPTDATTKVYIVDEAHQLTQPAWDAFLKTLEEPPPHTVFVLATTSPYRVPATIISRCQRFDLARIPQSEIVSRLTYVAAEEGIELESGVAERVARLAKGGLRDALGMLEQVAAYAGSPVTLDGARSVLGLVRGDALRSFLDALTHSDTRGAFEVVDALVEEGADLRQFLEELLGNLRALLHVRVGAAGSTENDFTPDERAWLATVAPQWAPVQLVAVMQTFSEIESHAADERQLLIRLELATAAATAQRGAAPLAEPPVSHHVGPAGAAASPPVADPGFDTAASAAPSPPRSNPTASQSPPVAASPVMVTPASTAPVVDSPPPSPTVDSTPPSVGAPSLAVLQAGWDRVIDRYQGNLWAKMTLHKVSPVALADGLLTLTGKIDSLDITRLDESVRKGLESLLTDEFGFPLRVRFRDGVDLPASVEVDELAPSVADFAASLFGGRVLTLNDAMMDMD